MKFKIFSLLFILCIGFGSTIMAEELPGKNLYTQVNMYSQKDKAISWVNYHVDRFIPINTEVTLNQVSDDKVILTIYATRQQLVFDNHRKQSGIDGFTWVKRHLGSQKVDLTKFTEQEKNAILSGRIETGMSKNAVLVAYGYPPAHKTPSLDMTTWMYWKNRWDRLAVSFDSQGKLIQIKN